MDIRVIRSKCSHLIAELWERKNYELAEGGLCCIYFYSFEPQESASYVEMTRMEMTKVMKDTQLQSAKLREMGKIECYINDFSFNKIPVYKKSEIDQKSESEQVKSNVSQKNVFSAGGMWMTLGFYLIW